MRKPKSVNVALGCNCWPPTAAVAVTVGQANRQSEVCSKKNPKPNTTTADDDDAEAKSEREREIHKYTKT